jgi:hypothetical protein
MFTDLSEERALNLQGKFNPILLCCEDGAFTFPQNTIHQNTRRYHQEDKNLHIYCRDKLKSHKLREKCRITHRYVSVTPRERESVRPDVATRELQDGF